MLWEQMQEPCRLWERRRASDGEGGFTVQWVAAGDFIAAVVHDASTEERVAEKQGVASSWTVTTSATLEYHDVFERLSDGAVFRVTSKAADGKTPSMVTFSFSQCTAEAWSLAEVASDGD